MISLIGEVEKINNITIGDPVVNIAQSTRKDKGEGESLRKRELVSDDNVGKSTGDENRKEGKNILSVLVPVEKPEDPSEVSRVDNGKK